MPTINHFLMSQLLRYGLRTAASPGVCKSKMPKAKLRSVLRSFLFSLPPVPLVLQFLFGLQPVPLTLTLPATLLDVDLMGMLGNVFMGEHGGNDRLGLRSVPHLLRGEHLLAQ
jgi:hypothetical protein